MNDTDRGDFVKLVRSLEAAPGLINRNPPTGYHDDQEGPDQYIALVAASHVLGRSAQQIANEVAAYGDSHGWLMNNVRKGSALDKDGHLNVSAAFLRFPQYVAHFHFCAGLPTDPVTEAVWAAVIANGAKHDSAPDSVVLQWFMIQCLPSHASPIVKAAVLAWARRFKQNYPNGLRDVNARNFKPAQPACSFRARTGGV